VVLLFVVHVLSLLGVFVLLISPWIGVSVLLLCVRSRDILMVFFHALSFTRACALFVVVDLWSWWSSLEGCYLVFLFSLFWVECEAKLSAT
jgi:hypothetical protein